MNKVNLKELTKEASFCVALKRIWEAGLESFQEKNRLVHLERSRNNLEREHLELSRLVHNYETKLQSLIARNTELQKQNRELEWAYRALSRENGWLKEEIFRLKQSDQD